MKKKKVLLLVLIIVLAWATGRGAGYVTRAPEFDSVPAVAISEQLNHDFHQDPGDISQKDDKKEDINSNGTGTVIEEGNGDKAINEIIDQDREENDKEESYLKIVAVGDILLGRGVGMRLENQQKGYIYPFELVADILKSGDIVFGNIEEPFTDSNHSLNPNMKYILKNKPESFEAIKYAGFNLVNLANNHILDFYEKGLFDTIDLLDKHGIAHAGAGKNLEEARKPAIIEKNNIKVGMIAYTDMAEIIYDGNPQISFVATAEKAGVAPRKIEYILEDIEKLRNQVDILIVSLHWGIEESFTVPAEQREFAYSILDAGADIILGHHPHQFQGIEIYKGKPIIYSLGNFIFDQNDPENQEGFIVNLVYKGNELVEMTAVPIRTIGKIQVVPLQYEDAKDLLAREVALCEELDTRCTIKDNILEFILP